jgi:hypothetical protein
MVHAAAMLALALLQSPSQAQEHPAAYAPLPPLRAAIKAASEIDIPPIDHGRAAAIAGYVRPELPMDFIVMERICAAACFDVRARDSNGKFITVSEFGLLAGFKYKDALGNVLAHTEEDRSVPGDAAALDLYAEAGRKIGRIVEENVQGYAPPFFSRKRMKVYRVEDPVGGTVAVSEKLSDDAERIVLRGPDGAEIAVISRDFSPGKTYAAGSKFLPVRIAMDQWDVSIKDPGVDRVLFALLASYKSGNSR